MLLDVCNIQRFYVKIIKQKLKIVRLSSAITDVTLMYIETFFTENLFD